MATASPAIQTKQNINDVNKIIASEKPPINVKATVKKADQVGQTKETFITQKGGKM
jgi:hypothetical protein